MIKVALYAELTSHELCWDSSPRQVQIAHGDELVRERRIVDPTLNPMEIKPA